MKFTFLGYQRVGSIIGAGHLARDGDYNDEPEELKGALNGHDIVCNEAKAAY